MNPRPSGANALNMTKEEQKELNRLLLLNAYSYKRPGLEPEDIRQEVWLNILQNYSGAKILGLPQFARMRTRWKALHLIRNLNIEHKYICDWEVLGDEEISVEDVDFLDDWEEAVWRKAKNLEIWKDIRRILGPCRTRGRSRGKQLLQTLVLDAYGVPTQMIAAQLDVDIKTVRQYKHRAIKLLRAEGLLAKWEKCRHE